MSHAPSPPARRRWATPLRVAAAYLVVSLSWILLSDWVVAVAGVGRWVDSVKGVGFVVATAGLLYWLVRRAFRAADRLRDSEEQHRALFDANPQPSWVLEPSTMRFLAVNDAAIARYGYSRAEFLAMTAADIRPPEDIPAVREAVRLAAGLNTGRVWRHRWRDGTLRRAEVSAHDIVYDGRAARLVVAVDATDRLRAEGVLALQSAVLEAVATGAPLADVLTRLAAGVEQLADGLVCSVLLLDGDRLRDGAGPSLPAAYRAAVDGFRIGPAAGTCGTAAFRRAPVVVEDIATDPLWDGIREVALPHGLRASWSTPVLGPDGRVLGTFALYYRTPRGPRPDEQVLVAAASHLAAVAIEARDAERALREREELLRGVITHIPVGVFWKDSQLVYLGCNDRFARKHGLPGPAAVVGRTDAELVTDPALAEAFRVLDRQVVETGTSVLGTETVLTRPDGSRIDLLTSRVPLRDAAGQVVGVLGVYQNVTERKALEERLRVAAKMEAVGRLAGGVAHDFNNLLTVISGYVELARGRLPDGEPGRDMLGQVLRASQRAADLTRQLLAYGRKQLLQPQVLDLGGLVTDLGQMLGRLIGEDVELALTPEPVRVTADPGQLTQVLMNLVVNARHAMPRGGRIAVRTAEVERGPGAAVGGGVFPAGRYALLEVSDTGVGMTAEVKARAFEPFFTTKGVGQGTGLGLATVFGVVEQSGGHVELESVLGQGTTVRALLPVAPAAEAVPPPPSPAAPVSGTGTVLLVEDDADVRALSARSLREAGYTVVDTASAAEAVEAAARVEPDILVTDVVMPGTGGRELADRLTAARPGLRVLYVSGYTDDAVLRHGVEQQAVQFLAKPFSPAALAAKVRAVLDGSAADAPSAGPSRTP